ncbi:uncharacterized protein LOC142319512 [Lycorma delicatula]|uniref:uncharacterized protein LOC142319512 n=1 Tax=Lycorma delicatula TaxID=130591 RepID=UPI003F51932F
MNLSQPPVLVGERIFWLGSGSGLPKPGLIRWIGHLPEIGQEDWTVGIELDEPLPYGGIDGAWGHRILFVCKQKHGLLVPITQIAPAFNLKFSKHHSDSLRQISYKENKLNNKQSFVQSKKRHSTGGFLGTQERQLAGTSVSYADRQGPLPVIRKKYQQQILTPNKDGENYIQEKRIINIPPSRCRKLALKYKKDEEISNRNIIPDDVSDNEKLYDCYSKFDTLRADEKADLLLSKCLESRSKKRDTIDIVDNSNDAHIKRMLSNYQNHIHSNKNNNHNVNNNNNNNIVIQSHQSDSHLEGITVSDTVFAARRQIFYKNGRSHSDETHTAVISSSISSSSSRKEKSASGIFSFFRWFKKDKEGEEEDDDDIGLPSAPASPRFIRSQSSSCGSVDTLFSTATANSFAFIQPAYYRPFGSAHQAETRITDSPETHTYRQRLLERERRRELEKDITLKKKYNLFGSSTIYKSADDIPRRNTEINKSSESLKHVKNISPASRSSTISRKKRKAPPPPVVKEKLNDYSLPNTLEHLNKSKKDNENAVELNCDDTKPHHRRTVSESAKDKKAGAYCHVRGKRKAPPPPVPSATGDNTTNVNKTVVQSSLGKKKRPAPQPPVNASTTKSDLKSENTANISLSTNNSLEKENLSSEKEKGRGSLSPEDKERLLKNIAKLQAVADRRSSICTPPPSPSLEQRMSFSISNDSLKLERGVLKSTKSEEGTSSTSPENKFTPSSPVSPRPWYKRNIIKDHGLSNGKLFDKKKEKTKMDDWMPEVGIPRASLINTNESSSKFNIFSKPEKNEEKRKSQISMLVNISELDREAAEIVQKEHAKEKAILAAEDAKFYTFPEDIGTVEINKEYQTSPNVEVPKRSSAKELISLFNAITNVTKVTVNTSFFSKEGSSLFSREGKEKRFSFGSSATSVTSTNDMNETIQTTQEKYMMTQNVITSENNDSKKGALLLETQQTYMESPGETRRRWNKVDVLSKNDDENDDTLVINDFNTDTENATGSRVTIEEIDEFDIDVERSSKTQALYEANRLRRHHSPSPSIPTIVEQSESASSVTTSPGSTSIRSQKTTTPTTPTTTFQQTITPLTSTALLPSQQNKRPTSIWACPQCTLENPRWRLTCEACDMWKPPLHSTNNKQINDPPINKNKSNDLTHTIEFNSKEKIAIDNLNEFQKNNDKTVEKSVLVNTNMDDAKHNAANKNAEKENSDNIVKEEKQKLTEEKFNDIDELRKARLAFFHKSSSNTKEIQTSNDKEVDETQNKPINSNSISSNNNINNIENEQAKLKEMLKDLKHSLPKRHKKNGSTEELDKNILDDKNNNRLTSHDESKQNRKEEIIPAVKNLGAIKKVPHSKFNQSKCDKTNYNNINHEEEKAEIYLVKTETIIEDVKVKKQLSSGTKPEKISTSVQTGAMVRKAESQEQGKLGNDDQIASKPPLGKLKSASPLLDKKEISIPITVEEYTIKDGVLYTSLSKEKQKIGTGTFELILAHDFAGIKATKTSKDATKLPIHHVYANVPNSEEEGNDDKKVLINHINNEPESVNINMNNEKAVEKLTVQLTQPKGLADFKAGLVFEAASAAHSGNKKHAGAQMMNTLSVNRLLRRLETAISKGQLKLAAKLAKELAQMKINCSVTRHKTIDDIVVDMYVEDKVSHQGPIPLMISPNFTVAQLKLKVEREFEIPVAVQRWILGKQLAADDSVVLMDVGINTPHCPIFLYLVAPEMGQERTSVIITTPENSDAILPSTSQPVPPPPPENVKRGGWYYNDEEDKYSFCEDTESELSDVSRPDTPHSLTDDNNEDLASEYSENEIAEEQDERPPTPPERNIEIEEAQPPFTPTGTLALGWKCELCTLVNSPTRPGCAACTSPRPQNYHVPQDYQVSQQELQRIRQEELQQEETAAERLQNYQALVDLENTDVVLNTEQFECPICFLLCVPQAGVILRDCLHTFCRGCLINTVQFNEEAEVKCPYRDTKYACDSVLLEREIKALVPPDVYEQHLAKSVAEAENKIGNAFHCKTPDCPGWCIFEDNVNEFLCPVCKHTNCLTCQAIHAGINCKQFQERAKQDSETNADARRTNEMLEEMVDRGEAMKCPTCQVILMKKWGCDWLRCSMCKTEICWVTRGPRWGPLGKGDTSGGCQCGVNGIKCHPRCNYCH